MTLGRRLWEARRSCGLSQAEAAGEEITRNMISRLEHDQGLPSLPTLLLLAERYGVSVSWLLGEPQAVELASRDEARRAFEEKDYLRCLKSLGDAKDQEAAQLRFRARIALAIRWYENGQMGKSVSILQEALAEENTSITSWERGYAYGQLAACQLELHQSAEVSLAALETLAEETSLERVLQLLRARRALQQGEEAKCEDLLSAIEPVGEEQRLEKALLLGQLLYRKGELQKARAVLRPLEQIGLSRRQEQTLYRLLEHIARDQGDYAMAYRYASARLEAHEADA